MFLGNYAGVNNTTASNNVFLGYSTGAKNTTGTNNVLLGNNAGYTNTISSNNVFIGNKAGYTTKGTSAVSFTNPRTNTSTSIYNGSNNVFLGNEAGYSNTTGYNNVFLGNYAGVKNTTASNNVFLGYSAGAKNTTGANNVLLGNNAGYTNTKGSSNVFIGDSAAYSNTEGNNNVVMGKNAGFTNAKGDDNVFIGNEAGYSTNSTSDDCWIWDPFEGELVPGRNGSNNVFLGKRSGYSNTTGYNNVFLGNFAGWHNTTGDNNIFIGFNTGSNTNGTNNILIGNQVDLEGDSDNNIMIGAQTSYDNEFYLYGEEGGYLNIGDLIQGKLYSGHSSEISDKNCGKLLVNGTIKAYSILPKFSNSNISHYYYRSNLGGATERWDTLYVGNINIASNRGGNLGGQIIGNLVPSTDGQNIGYYKNSTTHNLWNVYANNITAYGSTEFNGNVSFGGTSFTASCGGSLGCIQFTDNNNNTDKYFFPAGNKTVTLGKSNNRWKTVYVQDLDVNNDATITGTATIGALSTTGTATFGNDATVNGSLTVTWAANITKSLTVGGNLIVNGNVASNLVPSESSYNLGSNNNRWQYVYAQGMDVSSSTADETMVVTNKHSTGTVQSGVVGQCGNSSNENRGVYGTAYSTQSNCTNIGVYGAASNTSSNISKNYGVYGYANASSGKTAYAVYGSVPSANTNTASYAVYANGMAGGLKTWSSSSDSRLKKDVQPLTGALDKVLKLRGVSFYWKNPEEMAAAKGVSVESLDYGYDGFKHIGVIAQELEQEYPELVNTDGDGFKSVEYATLAPILIEAMKELKAEKDELKAEKDALEAKVDNQQKEIEQMKKMLEELLKKQ